MSVNNVWYKDLAVVVWREVHAWRQAFKKKKAHRCLKPDKDPMKRATEYTGEEVFQTQLFSKVYTK